MWRPAEFPAPMDGRRRRLVVLWRILVAVIKVGFIHGNRAVVIVHPWIMVVIRARLILVAEARIVVMHGIIIGGVQWNWELARVLSRWSGVSPILRA